MDILWAAVILGAMGLVFGLVLTGAAKVFAVPTNPKRDAVREVLPGANCGGLAILAATVAQTPLLRARHP